MAELLFGPTPHPEAVDFLRNKPAVSRAVFNGLLPDLKALAFTITGVEDLGAIARVQEKLANLPAGVPLGESEGRPGGGSPPVAR